LSVLLIEELDKAEPLRTEGVVIFWNVGVFNFGELLKEFSELELFGVVILGNYIQIASNNTIFLTNS